MLLPSAAISWSEGTALISAAEVWHSSPLPPRRPDIQMVPASCPGKIHWGGTRSGAASRWGHKTISVVPKEKCLLSEHATNVEVSRSAPDDPGERCHATPASVTGRNGFRADRQCLPHGCTIPEVSTDKAEGARTSGCPSDCGTVLHHHWAKAPSPKALHGGSGPRHSDTTGSQQNSSTSRVCFWPNPWH